MKYTFEIEISDKLLFITSKKLLDKMFRSHSFDICTIDKIVDILNIKSFRRFEIYQKFLHPLHCESFSGMEKETILKLKEISYSLINEYKEEEKNIEEVFYNETEFV